MKTQQRSFTVEIKSSRRRTKMQPKSIWGDTDFKALAREAEAAHFFKSGVVSDVVEAEERRSDLPSLENVENIRVEPECPVISHVSDIPPEPQAQETDPKPALEEMVQERHAVAVKAIPNAGDVVVKRAQRRPRSLVQAPAAEVMPSSQELERLENENRLLRAALVKHYEQENSELREMLERFK